MLHTSVSLSRLPGQKHGEYYATRGIPLYVTTSRRQIGDDVGDEKVYRIVGILGLSSDALDYRNGRTVGGNNTDKQVADYHSITANSMRNIYVATDSCSQSQFVASQGA